MKPKRKRLTFVILGLSLLGIAAGLVLIAFEENIVFFHSPSDVKEKNIGQDRRIRLGGLVEEGSVTKTAGGKTVEFVITDMNETIPVIYSGLLPDLFREGQGVVAEGLVKNGVFHADEVLAKHDENYMPPEVADMLKESGQWQHMEEALKASGQIKESATK
ncbi:MAG: cytochrome c maturation protein CcmE [Rhodospirillales bacterium]|nr:cytochrome c maturation protein CcmE [Rhodospirillales bacterium]